MRRSGLSQHPLEHHPPAQQCHRRATGIGDDGGACVRQSAQDVRHLGLQRLDHRAAEGVRMVELHHSPALPDIAVAGARVAVGDDDFTAPARESDGGEETGRARADDDCAHDDSI